MFHGVSNAAMKYELVILLLWTFPLGVPQTSRPASRNTCEKTKLFTAHHVVAWSFVSSPPAFFYKSGLAIDADGAFRAYHPNDQLGLDSLSHAGHEGNWWALVTDNEKPSGHPVVQLESDPAPGFYVSTTALYDPDNPNPRDPHRYVDAARIPYLVLHPKALNHARLGDFATVVNLQNGRVSGAIVADESAPNLPVGEGSIALAQALGVDASPRTGGKDGDIVYLVFPDSGNGKPRELEEIVVNATRLFDVWGGLGRLNACVAHELPQ
jgi:Fungal chitosanase of glycosyl hydrolase group 75